MKKFLLAATVLAAAASAQAQSTPSRVYLALGAGQSHLNYSCEGGTGCSNKDIGYKIVTGYRFRPDIAGEVSFVNYGKHVGTFYPEELGGTGMNVTSDVTSWRVGAAYSRNLVRAIEGTVRGGLAYSRTAYSASTENTFFNAENKLSLYVGAGVSLRLHDTASLFADIDLSSADDGVNGTFGVRLLSAGVKLDY
jgi:opacity protein-like surface antigen